MPSLWSTFSRVLNVHSTVLCNFAVGKRCKTSESLHVRMRDYQREDSSETDSMENSFSWRSYDHRSSRNELLVACRRRSLVYLRLRGCYSWQWPNDDILICQIWLLSWRMSHIDLTSFRYILWTWEWSRFVCTLVNCMAVLWLLWCFCCATKFTLRVPISGVTSSTDMTTMKDVVKGIYIYTWSRPVYSRAGRHGGDAWRYVTATSDASLLRASTD